MTRIVYQDVEDFAEAMRGTAGRFVRTDAVSSSWWIESIDLPTISLQQIQTGGPFAFAGKGKTGSLTFKVPLTSDGIGRINGQSVELDSLLVLHGDRHFVWTASDTRRWGTITVGATHALAVVALCSGQSLHATVCRRTGQHHLARLKRLMEGALLIGMEGDLAAASRDGAEGEIVDALTDALKVCFPASPARPLGRPPFSRSTVIASALAVMARHQGQPVFVHDLCRAAQVSERALRDIFNGYFGVGPMRLLKVRHLHEIRAALRSTDAQSKTVTEIAAEFGVFDLSLLARNYKALFGELPSQTLNRPPVDPSELTRVSWFQYASGLFWDEDLLSQ